MQSSHTQSRQVACGGLFTALGVMLMLTATLVPIATFIAPLAAGIALMPVAEELGEKIAYLCYAAIVLLSLFTVTDAEAVAMFAAFFGYYPILRRRISAFPSRMVRGIIKFVLFNLTVTCAYLVLIFVFSLSAVTEGMGPAYWLILLASGNLLLVCYDRLLGILGILYRRKIRPRIFGKTRQA